MSTAAAQDLGRLRVELEKRFGTAIRPLPGLEGAPERPGFRTGVRALDQLLPHGIARGAATLWTGQGTSGRTAAVRALVEAATRETRVALVDATRTLDPAAWCGPEGHSAPGLWVARPPTPDRVMEGAWVAEQLVRTGAFGLVVLDGPAPDPTEAHRLRALARETDTALLVSTEDAHPGWRADVRLEFRRAGDGGAGLRTGGRFRRRSGVRLARSAGARTGEREVELVHEPTNRLHTASRAADRRAAARR
ncbi:MAG TPA: hypothetical protein VF541_09695 [Longimicrobium sp.]